MIATEYERANAVVAWHLWELHHCPVKRYRSLITCDLRRALGERDGWQCGLCREAIDPELHHPDPRSASIDHVLPRALGGLDVESNLQIAHLVCNERKGKRHAT